jgi:hypothetical protein
VYFSGVGDGPPEAPSPVVVERPSPPQLSVAESGGIPSALTTAVRMLLGAPGVAGSGVAESADSTSDAESSVDAEEETIETIDLDREIADLEALQKRALIALSRALMKSSTRKRAIRQATASLAKVRDKIAAIRRELDGLMKDDFDRANVLPSGMKPGSWEARSWLGRNPQVRVSRLGRQERERARILMAELPAWEHTRDSLEHTIQQIEGSRAPEMTDVRASLETILTEGIGSVAAVNLGVAREALRGKHTVIQRLVTVQPVSNAGAVVRAS